MSKSVDELDRAIIRRLQDDPRASYTAMARLTGVSEATVRRRVRALFASGVIWSAVVTDFDTLGLAIRSMVGLKTDLDTMAAVAESLSGYPEVTYVAIMLGRYNVVFYTAHTSLDALTRFLAEQVASLPGIRETEVMVAAQTLKAPHWPTPVSVSPDGSSTDTGSEGNAYGPLAEHPNHLQR